MSLKIRVAILCALGLLTALATGCVVVRVYDTAKVGDEFSRSLKTVADHLATIESEANEQKEVLAGLHQRRPKGWDQSASKARSLYEQVTVRANNLKNHQKKMNEYNGQLGALAYSQPKIESRDPQWAQADQLIKNFKAEAQSFNKELNEFARADQALNQFWQSSGFYQTISIVDIDERLETNPQNWRGEHAQMVARFNKAKKSFESYQEKSSEESADLLQALATHLEDMSQHAERFRGVIQEADELRQGFREVFGAKTKISNLDTEWTRFEQFKARHKSLGEQHNIEGLAFQKAEENFNKVAKALRAL